MIRADLGRRVNNCLALAALGGEVAASGIRSIARMSSPSARFFEKSRALFLKMPIR